MGNDGSVMFSIAIGLIAGIILGIYIGKDIIKDQSFKRGHMVECVGKSGYYWECEK